MTHLDGAAGDRIGGLRRADDLARREGLDLELAVRGISHELGEGLAAAEERIERFGEGGSQAPADLGLGLGNGGTGDRAGCGTDRGGLDESTAFHGVSFYK